VLDDLPKLDRALVPTGRRLCRVEELLLASAGPDNWRYPYHPEERSPDACDPNDPSPDPFGSFVGCSSPLGVRDFLVRSSWARSSGGGASDAEFVVVGGLVREDTVYAATNFGVHEHLRTDPRNFEDDGVRLCRDPGQVDAAREAAWSDFLTRAVAAGSFEAMVGSLDGPGD